VNPFAGWAQAPLDAARRGGIHLWGASVSDLVEWIDGFHEVLSPDERQRAAAFRFDRHRAAYVVAHGVMREVLSRYLGRDAGSIVFDVGDAGRPHLSGETETDLDFNLSHAGDAIVMAVANQRIGVDVEEVKADIPYTKLARRFFAETEIEAVEAAGRETAPAVFFECWTRKEAIVKAVGRGLSMGLDSFGVSPSATHQRISVGDDGMWTVVGIGLAPGYVGAVATQEDDEVERWNWAPASLEDHH
jgi:4'-phosphopantetheinyl transferase